MLLCSPMCAQIMVTPSTVLWCAGYFQWETSGRASMSSAAFSPGTGQWDGLLFPRAGHRIQVPSSNSWETALMFLFPHPSWLKEGWSLPDSKLLYVFILSRANQIYPRKSQSEVLGNEQTGFSARPPVCSQKSTLFLIFQELLMN